MFELICALGIGIVFGLLFKKEQNPPLVDELQEKIKKLEEDVSYYKDLCKWHTEKNNTSWDNFKMNKDIQ